MLSSGWSFGAQGHVRVKRETGISDASCPNTFTYPIFGNMRFAALRPTPAEAPRLLPVTVSTAGIPASGDPFEAPYAQRPAGSPDTLVFYQFDHLGNTRLAYRSLGGTRQVLHTADYYPFGKPLRTWSYSASQALRHQSTGHVERSEIPHQGIGKRDRESGLDYRLARFYDSDVGRFLSVDPLADHPNQVDKSPYAYTWNNPVKLRDPDGNCPICPFIAKGLAGAVIDYMLQGAFNYAGGMSMQDAFSISNIDMSDVAISGLQGALPWNVPGGKYGKAAGAAVTDILFNYAKYLANDEDYSMEQMGQDFLIGFAAQLGAEKVGELFGNKIDNLTANGFRDEAAIGHIFREDHGLANTISNRKMLLDVARDKKYILGTDKYGNTWNAFIRDDGSQVWTQSRNGKIFNGGINQTAKEFNPETGLSGPDRR